MPKGLGLPLPDTLAQLRAQQIGPLHGLALPRPHGGWAGPANRCARFALAGLHLQTPPVETSAPGAARAPRKYIDLARQHGLSVAFHAIARCLIDVRTLTHAGAEAGLHRAGHPRRDYGGALRTAHAARCAL